MRVEKACGVIGRKTIEIKDVELELFGGSLRIDRNGWRTVPGNFLARCRRQLLAPFGALDPAIFDKAGKTDNQQVASGAPIASVSMEIMVHILARTALPRDEIRCSPKLRRQPPAGKF